MEDKTFDSDFCSFGVHNRPSKRRESVLQSDMSPPPANISIISCISGRNSLDNQIQMLKSQLLAEDQEKSPDRGLLNKLEELYSKRRMATTPWKHRKCYSRNISVLMGKEDLLKEIESLKERIGIMENEQANMCQQLVEALKLVKDQMIREQSKDKSTKDNLDENISFRKYETKSTEGIDQSIEYPKQDTCLQPKHEEQKKKKDVTRSYKKSAKSTHPDTISSKPCQCIVF